MQRKSGLQHEASPSNLILQAILSRLSALGRGSHWHEPSLLAASSDQWQMVFRVWKSQSFVRKGLGRAKEL